MEQNRIDLGQGAFVQAAGASQLPTLQLRSSRFVSASLNAAPGASLTKPSSPQPPPLSPKVAGAVIYTVEDQTFRRINAKWTIPNAYQVEGKDGEYTMWIGFNGTLKAGVDATVTAGGETLRIFLELYGFRVYIPSFSIKPGDLISVFVEYDTTKSIPGTVSYGNEGAGTTTSLEFFAPDFLPLSGMYALEDVSPPSGALPDYGATFYWNIYAETSDPSTKEIRLYNLWEARLLEDAPRSTAKKVTESVLMFSAYGNSPQPIVV